ncbi:MAG TPA: hypothetical protein VH105_17400 [Burkholderiales bacterium]|jgi:hypothetical protein|nr:hypothetical protein [Burkholderiales bacterium]
MHTDELPESGAEEKDGGASPPAESFRWLPRSPFKRVLLGVAAALFTVLVFGAYLAPGLAFDLANMVFCG